MNWTSKIGTPEGFAKGQVIRSHRKYVRRKPWSLGTLLPIRKLYYEVNNSYVITAVHEHLREVVYAFFLTFKME